MEQEKILDIFKKSNALLNGHFLLSSGLHSDIYFEKFQVLQYPEYVELLCRELAMLFKEDDIQVVVGPTTGGIIIAYEVAKNLKVKSIFAELKGDKRIFKRGFELKEGERVLIVDDIMTTGKSVREVIELVRDFKANIVGIGVLMERSGGNIKFDYPFKPLSTVTAKTFKPEECPLCKEGQSLVKPGSRE